MRLYRWLLRLCPKAFREEYGAAMEETFVRRLADAHGTTMWRRGYVWTRELAGLTVLAVSDMSIFISTTVLLLSVTLLACWLPARRAARLSPIEALRTD